jgi:hypothetical protein
MHKLVITIAPKFGQGYLPETQNVILLKITNYFIMV